jgi:FkbM family methyltransferase
MQKKSFLENIFQGIRFRLNKLFYNPYRALNVGPVKKIYYKHLNPGVPRTHQLFGKELHFISATELLHGLKEIFVEEIYKQELPANPYIIDCGANIGLSVIYLKQRHPDAEILAFEPDEGNFKLLEKNIGNFGYEKVHLHKEAVWTENTTLQFAGEGSMSSRIDSSASVNTVAVKAVRLKDYLNRPVDFLKIDIEGAEYEVMMDIADQLVLVKNLFLEYHGSFNQNEELNRLFSLIVEKGFSYYIKEATSVYPNPFVQGKGGNFNYDVQLNIFCFRLPKSN